jgi:hypothetical protein
MVSLGYNYVLLLLLLLSLLITTQIGVTLSSCEPDTVGTCGCCKNFTTECVIIPSNIIPSFESYEKYICVPKLSTPNFSLNHCNCTSKEPTFCICPNQYPNIYPVYSTCYSFTECIINDIKVNAQQKIRGKTVIPSYLLFHYVFSFFFLLQREFVKKLSVIQDVVQKTMSQDFIMIPIRIVVKSSSTVDAQSIVLHL